MAEQNERALIDIYTGGVGKEDPTLGVFMPTVKATGAAMLVLPGGGYEMVVDHENYPVGKWLAGLGITAFVLRYRVSPHKHPIPMQDGQRAMRLIRARAAEWGIDKHRLGVIGFSAGGHLATTLATHWTRGDAKAKDVVDHESSRPDVQAAIYAVITFGMSAHQGSCKRLLGEHADPALVNLLSNELQVDKETPGAFLFHSVDDLVVPVANSDLYAESLKKHHVDVEYVRGNYGGHGIGVHPFWTTAMEKWLRAKGF